MTTRIALTAWNGAGSGISGSSVFTNKYSNTWDVLVGHYMSGLWSNANKDKPYIQMGMLSEAGTPPSTKGGGVYVKDAKVNGKITSSPDLNAEYCWYGWSKAAGGTNLRCSLAIFQGLPKLLPSNYPLCSFYTPVDLAALTGKTLDTRPAAGAKFSVSASKLNLDIYLVHLPSGQKQRKLNFSILRALTSNAASSGTAAIIAGDMNIDIISQTDAQVMAELNLSTTGWRLLRTGYQTQISGGELDWALAYKVTKFKADMIGPLTTSTGAGRGLGYVASGISDHAMVNYVIEA